MVILWSIAFLITIVYNLFIVIKYKQLPISLSETAYLLGKKRLFFTGYCSALALCLCPCLFMITPINLQFLVFFIGVGLMMSGVSPLFKEGLDKYVHYTYSILAFILLLVYLFIMEWPYFLALILWIILFLFIKKESIIYLAEIGAIMEILIYILIYII